MKSTLAISSSLTRQLSVTHKNIRDIVGRLVNRIAFAAIEMESGTMAQSLI